MTASDVDAWMVKYDNPQKPLVQSVREAILAADPRVSECIKWQAPTFTYKGNIASFFPKAKQHVSLMFHTGAKIPGSFSILEGDASEGRTVKVTSADDLEAKRAELSRIVQAWCDMQDSK
jgi:uncharacterized protein YdhG (YjbR/CyaY superfamily)